ncbi:TPA: hypothetical protein N0F65_012066 [Lagenidium giganteum]|uniref:Snurportin-1 n=1 Tax=Lagenidium giganteum TaxID=4803 RepID=A0AAV2YGY6_9STRA|nr:TPA: hypothetical protein N0F65_012066 [Lagenidium giganteum]
MADSSTKRIGIKTQQWTKDAAARRSAMLQKQRQARRDLDLHARRLAAGSHADGATTEDEGSDDGAQPMELSRHSKKKTREERVKARRERFAQQLLVPEWMVDVPAELNGKGSELGAGWYVEPRPEGKRCLVVTSGGQTIARIPAGSVLKKFPSALPGGSHKTNGAGDTYCILDCIFHEHDSTFYVLDVMCWKGYLLYNCTTEFRFYWMRDKLSEGTAGTVSRANPYRFLTLPCYECDAEGVQAAHSTQFPFLKDGLLFYLKGAHYDLGLTPLVLVWKDAVTSRFHVFTEKPAIVLRLNEEGVFTTLEGIPLFETDESFRTLHELSEGDLAKLEYDDQVIDQNKAPRLNGMRFVQRCSPQRALADSWTKIQFQYNARIGGVQINDILQVSAASADTLSPGSRCLMSLVRTV